MKNVVFILAGHCAGKSTLARGIVNSSPVPMQMIGGYHGADTIKDRTELYTELEKFKNDEIHQWVILESAFVDNVPVVHKILAMGYHINALYLNVSNEARGIRRNLKDPTKPAKITKEQHMSQLEAASLFKKLRKMEITNPNIRCRIINANESVEVVLSTAMRILKGSEPI